MGAHLGPSLAVLLLLASGCGTGSGTDDGPDPLPEETYQRVLSQGVDPDLVHTIELPGFELAEQSAGVLGDADYGAVYLPVEPPYTVEVYLMVKVGSYDQSRCERDSLPGPSGDFPAAVESCEVEAGGWYRRSVDAHEYVVRLDGHHLVVGAPSDALDREVLTTAALSARRQDGTTSSPLPPSSPVTRGDLPSNGDGAPVDPYGESPPGG